MKKILFVFLAFACISCNKKNTQVEKIELQPIIVEPVSVENTEKIEIKVEMEPQVEPQVEASKNEKVNNGQELSDFKNAENVEISKEMQVEEIDESGLKDEDFCLIKDDEKLCLYGDLKQFSKFNEDEYEYSVGVLRFSNYDGLKIAWNTNFGQMIRIDNLDTEVSDFYTSKNIRVGSTVEEVFAAYGDAELSEEGTIVYEKKHKVYKCQIGLIFYVKDNKVWKIHIEEID